MDAFYASVEQRDRPELRGKPVIVGGSPSGRGVVATCSYEARKFGVRSAMPAAQAVRLCPHAEFVRPDFSKYKEASQKIREIFHEVTDIVEPLSLDEAFLDVTENKLSEPSAMRVARYVKSRIKGSLRLTASAGVSPLKFLSKIASDLEKPDGLVVIPPEKVDSFIAELKVEKLWSVGPATAARLHKAGIYHAKDIRKFEAAEFEQRFGKHGIFLYRLAHGKDSRRVSTSRVRKSRGTERTFSKDIVDLDELCGFLEDQAIELWESLQKSQDLSKNLTLKVRYDNFDTVTRSRTVAEPFRGWKEIYIASKNLLVDKTEAGSRPVRLIGTSLSMLHESDSEIAQLEFEL